MGECIDLKWGDVDERCSTLTIQQKQENPGTILADSSIFPGETGIFEARDPNAVTRRVKRFMKANGLPNLSPRDLRHLYVKLKTYRLSLITA